MMKIISRRICLLVLTAALPVLANAQQTAHKFVIETDYPLQMPQGNGKFISRLFQ